MAEREEYVSEILSVEEISELEKQKPYRLDSCPYCGGWPSIEETDGGAILRHDCEEFESRRFDSFEEALAFWNKLTYDLAPAEDVFTQRVQDKLLLDALVNDPQLDEIFSDLPSIP